MRQLTHPHLRRLLFKLLLTLVMFAGLASAQTSSGGGVLQGTVRDSSGAAVPGATVRLTHMATGRVLTLTTNESGFFVTPTTNIGKYKIRIEATGMKAWEGETQVETAREIAIEPILRVGDVSETVTVEGNITPLVTTTDPTTGSTLESQRITELPINGRNINTLLEDTVPGVEAIIDVNGGVRTAGLMVYSTDFVQDGAASNNREFGGSGIIQGLEAIAEVRVETSTSSARYNRPASVVVTTKGGGNQLHFTAFETHRNNGFGVARARQDVLFNGQDYKVPTLLRNEYGFSASGPVFLPKFGGGLYNGKNRTFWFFSRESLRLKQGITREFVVPAEAWRRGDFSGMVDNLGRPITLYDPATTRLGIASNGAQVMIRDPFPNNIIPASRMSPLAKAIFAITPLPTDPGINPLVANNYKSAVATNGLPNRRDDQNAIRLDHRFGEKDNAFFKISGGRNRANFIGTAGNTGAPTLNKEANVTYLPMEGITGAISWTHLFSQQFFVETLINRQWQSTRTLTGPTTEDFSKSLGLPNPLGEPGFPNITGNGFMNYIEGDNRRALFTIVSNVEQNYSWVKNTHNLQFGGRWRAERQHLQPDQGAISGSAAFNSLATALLNPSSAANNPQAMAQTGHDAANFFLGHAASYTIGLKRNFMKLTEKQYGLYVQDSWRISKRLTLTPGVRWDMYPAFKEANSAINAFDEKTRSMYFPEPVSYYIANGATTQKVVDAFKSVDVKFVAAEEIGRPRNIFKSNMRDIGPRFGLAYKMFDGNKQMVIRGGYGLYISNTPMRSLLAPFFGLPPFRANFSYNPNSAAQSPDGIGNYLLRNTIPFVAGSNVTNIVDAVNPVGIGRGQAVAGMAEDQRNMRIHEWNLALEKQIGQSSVVRLTYSGKHGVNSDQQFQINPQANDYIWYVTQQRAFPTGAFASVARRIFDQTAYTNITIYQKTGYINTSTWSLEFERRFRKGLGFQ
ncbi:MAG: TonB-dependent receptor, partial [Blastocatellia bacterium]